MYIVGCVFSPQKKSVVRGQSQPACLPACLSVCLSVCLPVCARVCPSQAIPQSGTIEGIVIILGIVTASETVSNASVLIILTLTFI